MKEDTGKSPTGSVKSGYHDLITNLDISDIETVQKYKVINSMEIERLNKIGKGFFGEGENNVSSNELVL